MTLLEGCRLCEVVRLIEKGSESCSSVICRGSDLVVVMLVLLLGWSKEALYVELRGIRSLLITLNLPFSLKISIPMTKESIIIVRIVSLVIVSGSVQNDKRKVTA